MPKYPSVQLWLMEKVQLYFLCGISRCFFHTVEWKEFETLFLFLLLTFHCKGWMFHLFTVCGQSAKSLLCPKTYLYNISMPLHPLTYIQPGPCYCLCCLPLLIADKVGEGKDGLDCFCLTQTEIVFLWLRTITSKWTRKYWHTQTVVK